MRTLVRRSRGPITAIAVLAISAGVAFAGGSMPSAAADGLATAAEAAGKVVPTAPDVEAPVVPANDPPAEIDDPADLDRDAHGVLVSEAAQLEEVPDGFANRGQFVSCVARLPHGEDATRVSLAGLTPEMCDEMRPGKSVNAGRPDGAGKPDGAGAGSSSEGAGRAAEGRARGGGAGS